MIKRFFTSDQHFGDDRFNLFYRPFTSVEEQNEELIKRWNSVVKPDDIVDLANYITGYSSNNE